MNLQLPIKIALSTAALLLMLSTTANAVCRPNSCEAQRDQCLATGGTRCEIKYYRCLEQNGCQIP